MSSSKPAPSHVSDSAISHALVSRPPSALACALVRQLSKSRCELNVSFGCDLEEPGVWVSSGCRAIFHVHSARRLFCGFAGGGRGGRYVCRVPSASAIEDCNCQYAGHLAGGMGIMPGRRVCDAPAINASWACSGGNGGGSEATCCAANASGECPAEWTRCRWHGHQRIGWLHTPKSGTSFLLALARLANNSLPTNARIPSVRYGAALQWEALFKQWRPTTWFSGSALFWREGIGHAGLSSTKYEEFRGRLFAMFRDPRVRGWSAYHFFAWNEQAQHHVVSPQVYAKCIAGTQTAALTGELPTVPYGAVCTHELRNGLCVRGKGKCWMAATPNLSLARRRLDEGFAFVGLTEQWPLSICLFVSVFGISCTKQLFLDSRVTPVRHEQNGSGTAAAAGATAAREADHDVFADPIDMQLWLWAKARFEADLRRLDVTPIRCARDICPEASAYFTKLEVNLPP